MNFFGGCIFCDRADTWFFLLMWQNCFPRIVSFLKYVSVFRVVETFFCVFVECFVFVFPFIVVVKLTIKWKKKKRIIKWILDIVIFFLMWRSASCLFKWLLLFDIRFWRFCFWILFCWSCEILNGKCPIRGCH